MSKIEARIVLVYQKPKSRIINVGPEKETNVQKKMRKEITFFGGSFDGKARMRICDDIDIKIQAFTRVCPGGIERTYKGGAIFKSGNIQKIKEIYDTLIEDDWEEYDTPDMHNLIDYTKHVVPPKEE